MGILKPHIHIFCMEQKERPVIRGQVLTLGQQAVYSTLHDVRSILGSHGIQAKQLPQSFDTATKIPGWKGTENDRYTNAQSVLTLLGADNVYAADVSAYENPDFLIDLNIPVSDSYHERFDTIVDAGTLEHCLDIRIALENICKMLKKGGSVVIITPCSNFIDHGFYSFSPTLFYDYFGSNGFANIGCYLREGSPWILARKGRLFKYDRVGGQFPLVSKWAVEVAFVATKDKTYNSEELVKPVQAIYRNSTSWNTDVTTTPNPHALTKLLRIKLFVSNGLSHMHKFYPFFVEKLIYGRRKTNLKYLGKY